MRWFGRLAALWCWLASAGDLSVCAGEPRFLSGHTEPVYAVAYTPDGKHLVSGSFDKTVRIWDRVSGRVVATLADHTNLVLALAVSADGKQLASAGLDKNVLLYDFPSTAPVGELPALAGDVRLTSLSADGRLLAAVIADAQGAPRRVQVESTENGQVTREWATAADVIGLGLSPDASQLLAICADGLLTIWQTADGQAVHSWVTGLSLARGVTSPDLKWTALITTDGQTRVISWPAPPPSVWTNKDAAGAVVSSGAVAVYPDVSKVIAGGGDGRIHVWQTNDGAVVRSLEQGGGAVVSLSLSPDAQRLVALGSDGIVKLWNPTDGANLLTLPTGGAQRDVAWRPVGGELATAGADGMVRLWPIEGRAAREFAASGAALRALAISADGALRAVAGDEGIVKIQRTADGGEVRSYPSTQAPIRALAFSPDGQRVAAAGDDRRIRILNVGSGGVLSIDGPMPGITSLAWSPNGQWIACGGTDHVVRVWNAGDGALVRELTGHTSPVTLVAFGADGTQLVSVGDSSARIWKLDDGALVRLIDCGAAIVQACVTRDATKLAVACQDGSVRVFQSADVSTLWTLPAGTAVPAALAFQADGATLIVARSDQLVVLYRADQGEVMWQGSLPSGAGALALAADGPMAIVAGVDGRLRDIPILLPTLLAGHSGPVTCVAYASDGKRLFTGGADSTIRVWNLESKQAEGVFAGAADGVIDLAVSGDGQYLAAVSGDRQVRWWKIADQSLVQATAVGALPTSVTISLQPLRASVGCDDGVVRSFEVGTSITGEQFAGHAGMVRAAVTTPDGRRVVTCGADGTVRMFSYAAYAVGSLGGGVPTAIRLTNGGTEFLALGDVTLSSFNAADLMPMHQVAAESGAKFFTTDAAGRLAAVCGMGNTIRVKTVIDDRTVCSIQVTAAVTQLELAPDAKRLMVGCGDGVTRVYRLPDGLLTHEMGAGGAVVALAISGDGKSIWTIDAGRIPKRWNAQNAGPRLSLAGHTAHIYALDISPDGTRLASAGADKAIKLWQTADGKNYANAAGHDSQVYGLAFAPNGEALASCGADKTIRFWNPADGAAQRQLSAEIADGLYSLDVSPDGSQWVAAGLAKTWQLWNGMEEKPAKTVVGHPDHIYRIAFDPSGKRVATIGYGANLFVWDVASGGVLHQQQLPVKSAYGLAYSPDGAELAIATVDQRVLLVEVPPGAR
jgi:WD40 repeat protein